MRLGLISDVHVDAPALNHALTVVERRGAVRVVCMGDVVEKGDAGDRGVDALRANGRRPRYAARMSVVTIAAMSYAEMQAFLAKEPTSRGALLASRHARTWVISITSSPRCPVNAFEGWPDEGPPPLVTTSEDRLALVFDDVEPPAAGEPHARYVYFDDAMAGRVVDFVRRAHTDDPARPDLLLVNCHAGVSRSGAVAEAARVITGVAWESFRRQNAQVVPNAWVRARVLAAWASRDG